MSNNLYEDLYGDIKRVLNNKERRFNIANVKLNKSDSDEETETSGSNFNNGKMGIGEDFSHKLVTFLDKELDKSFPSHTRLKSVIMYEVKKIMKTGNEKEIKRVVEKIRDIILKERVKFMDTIEKKVSKILIDKY